jgi:hypothetical protein
MLFVVQPGGTTAGGAERVGSKTGYYACGVVGLGLAVASLFLTYSVLVTVTSLVPLLSTTAIAFVGVLVWLGFWLGLDATRSWVVRRRSES